MATDVGIITRDGHRPIPTSLLAVVGLKPRDQVEVSWDGERMQLRRAPNVVERTMGAPRSDHP